jgi:hypothetical protein
MYGNLGDAFIGLYRFMIFLLVIAVPLALWKLVEIVIWVFQHVQIEVLK